MGGKGAPKREASNIDWQQGQGAWWVKPGEDADTDGCFLAEVDSYDGGANVTLTGIEGPVKGKKESFAANQQPGNDGTYAAERDMEFPEAGFQNMTELAKLNEAELNRNLNVFYDKPFGGGTYCWCGNTLVAMNLYDPKASSESKAKAGALFSTDQMKSVYDKSVEEVNAHMFALMEQMYQSVLLSPDDDETFGSQALVITGESGAGKSFQTGEALNYLKERGNAKPVEKDGKTVPAVTDRMRSANNILEIFGNASMPRNPDSSRFGKLFQVFFEPDSEGRPTVMGCQLTPYLLEKVRVSQQSHNERNYHIFYGILADKDMCAKYGLTGNPKDYFYLNRFKYEGKSSDHDLLRMEAGSGRDDLKKFKEVLDKFADLSIQFPQEALDEIFGIVAGILKLGNVEIQGDDVESTVKDPAALKEAADLLKVSPESLENAMCHEHKDIGGGKIVTTNKSKRKAEMLRDALSKTVYDDMFVEYICKGISKDLADGRDLEDEKFVGILDIFGFEFTSNEQMKPTETGGLCNSLGQFCINLCNEQLQNHFVESVIKTELKTYKRELGTEVQLDFPKNDKTLDLLMGKKKSIISKLTEAGTKPGEASEKDEKLAGGIVNDFKDFKDDEDKSIVLKVGNKDIKDKQVRNFLKYMFGVNHYAGPVTYCTNQWMDLDVNKLTMDGAQCFAGSGHTGWLSPFYTTFLEEEQKGPKTISENFKVSLQSLMSVLQSCNCNFVRCIKPRLKLENSGYQGCYVLNQLKYTGMLATLQIRKLGYPIRMSHLAFMDKYGILNRDAPDKDALAGWILEQDWYALTHNAEMDDGDDKDDIRMGQNKVLMRDDLARALDRRRNEKLETSVVIIQAQYRASVSQMAFESKRQAAIKMEPMMRRVFDQLKYLEAKWNHIDVQGRSNITNVLRASQRRNAYYHERIAFFEGINRQNACRYIMSTVMRQKYYEQKLLKVELELIAKERERFEVYEAKSVEYGEDLQVEAAAEREERDVMCTEDDYVAALMQARIEEVFAQEKNSLLLQCEEMYKRAGNATRWYRAQQQGEADLESKYAEYKDEMDAGAHKRVYMMLKQQYDELGKTELYPYEEGRNPTDSHLTLVAPHLRSLPPDMDSVVMMKRYIHKGKQPPKRDLSEGFDLNNLAAEPEEEEMPTESVDQTEEASAAPSPGDGGAKASLELELSVNPASLTPEEQLKFVNELAGLMGVDPSAVSVSSVQ